MIKSVNPATGAEIRSYALLTPEQLDSRLALAWTAYLEVRRRPMHERAGWVSAVADILEKEKRELGRLMTEEMGKPIGAAIAEAEKCALACRYYAENAERLLGQIDIPTDARRSYVRFDPIGPILAVMPWNFPFWQVIRFAAPAVMAGNVALLKHASNVPGCALAIEEIFRRAGAPEGTLQTLLIEVDDVQRVLDDDRVRAATLTGSTRAGAAIAQGAGRKIKKTVLELGGSDPFIVMPSADLERAIRTAVTARTINNGQSCIAAKRFIVHEQIYSPFVEGFVAGMEALRVGDPMDEATQIGPLATPSIRDGVDDQVQRSVRAGARLLTGGARLDLPGYYYPPTALDQIPDDAPAATEEIFGPVASIFQVSSIEDAIQRANDSVFGLGSSVWTTDPAEQERFVREIEAGQVFVNAMVASHPKLPFGGVKESGYGRELGEWGIREFVNVKTVWVDAGGPGETKESAE